MCHHATYQEKAAAQNNKKEEHALQKVAAKRNVKKVATIQKSEQIRYKNKKEPQRGRGTEIHS
jgi:hypothetical protein